METTFTPSHRTRPLNSLLVIDAMHPGMVSCAPETPLTAVARMMATYRVHAIFVHAHGEDLPSGGAWAVVTDVDLVRAALDAELDTTAGRVGAAPVIAVTTTEPLDHAMQLMVEHEVTHAVVVEGHSGRPVGVLSTLDVARAVAGLA